MFAWAHKLKKMEPAPEMTEGKALPWTAPADPVEGLKEYAKATYPGYDFDEAAFDAMKEFVNEQVPVAPEVPVVVLNEINGHYAMTATWLDGYTFEYNLSPAIVKEALPHGPLCSFTCKKGNWSVFLNQDAYWYADKVFAIGKGAPMSTLTAAVSVAPPKATLVAHGAGFTLKVYDGDMETNYDLSQADVDAAMKKCIGGLLQTHNNKAGVWDVWLVYTQTGGADIEVVPQGSIPKGKPVSVDWSKIEDKIEAGGQPEPPKCEVEWSIEKQTYVVVIHFAAHIAVAEFTPKALHDIGGSMWTLLIVPDPETGKKWALMGQWKTTNGKKKLRVYMQPAHTAAASHGAPAGPFHCKIKKKNDPQHIKFKEPTAEEKIQFAPPPAPSDYGLDFAVEIMQAHGVGVKHVDSSHEAQEFPIVTVEFQCCGVEKYDGMHATAIDFLSALLIPKKG